MRTVLLFIIGLLFTNIKNVIFILALTILSLILSYFKRFYGLLLYSITLIYLVNQLVLENLFSVNGFYAIIFLILPSFLFLDTLIQRNIQFNEKYPIYLIPLISAILGFYNISTFLYTVLLFYTLYERFRYLDKVLIVKIFFLFITPIIALYIFYLLFLNIFNSGVSQCSVLISISGILLIIYKIKKF
ncbi:hypothetical protein Metig_1512 [Methanotorris igneus Kol 5]|uniref:Uncharacterized protein n=1 Tax=Methanotorris igneus (strain DSM 5666 / JCM 11834 / Kol 5) TaxID=880724 RepID=F6BAV9_METIK|nr:hypothetical protein Metig_1512 [Methanotorris igneus Kol 5]